MKRLALAVLSLLICFRAEANQGTKFSFVYMGVNMYVQNPLGAENGFCIKSLLVNGTRSTKNFESSAFEIDFVSMGLQIGDSVCLEFIHSDDCSPKILNPNSFNTNTKIVRDFYIDSLNRLHFTPTEKINSPQRYAVMHYRWGRWVKAGEDFQVVVTGKECVLDIGPYLLAGMNYFCVTMPLPCMGVYGPVLKLKRPRQQRPVLCDQVSRCETVLFSENTCWQVWDANGCVKSGYGQELNCSFLVRGKPYTLYYDNTHTSLAPRYCDAPPATKGNPCDEIQLSPNPADGQLRIVSGTAEEGKILSVDFIAITGQVLLAEKIPGGTEALVSTAQLAEGVYFCRVRDANQVLYTGKFLIRH